MPCKLQLFILVLLIHVLCCSARSTRHRRQTFDFGQLPVDSWLDKDILVQDSVDTETRDDTEGLRPLSERTCQYFPFVCQHGYCSEASCVCDKGWIGLLCTDRCTLDCVHGSCLVIQGIMFCNCQYNYGGERCEKLIPK